MAGGAGDHFAQVPGQNGRAPLGVPARPQLLKRRNLALVLGEIATSKRLSRAQLSSRTGLTKATVSTLVDALMEAGLVVEHDPERGLIGRPGSPVTLNPADPPGSASRSTSTTSRCASSISPERCDTGGCSRATTAS